ncbi:MAG: hypothetical protein IKB62_01175 [Oscillospiraceae bacterium]|nr:hypothetical protein [Oscillospiraceae bacterium]
MAKKFNYKKKSVKGTDALVEWLNTANIQPKQIVSVSYSGEWATVIYQEEVKEKDNAES